MGKSLKFGLISTISIKGICRDNVANDCFCSWFFGWFGCLGVFVRVPSLCSAADFVELGFSAAQMSLGPRWLFQCHLQEFIFSVAIKHFLPCDLLKLNLSSIGFIRLWAESSEK